MPDLLQLTTPQSALHSSSNVILDHYRCQGMAGFPANADDIVNNLRYERYVVSSGWQGWVRQSWLGDAYYQLRPLLPVSVRKHLQRIYWRGWDSMEFPSWPLDRSADLLLEKFLILAMQEVQTTRLPFIWFWPKGHRACAIMTHDVETTAGRDFCEPLMDMDDAFGLW